MVLDKRTYRQIEWALYHYHELRRATQDQEEEILAAGSRVYSATGWLRAKGKTGDPTAVAAMRLVEMDFRWLDVVERTIARYKRDPRGAVLRKRYFEERSFSQIAQEQHIDRMTLYRWRCEIIMFAALIAAQKGLLQF